MKSFISGMLVAIMLVPSVSYSFFLPQVDVELNNKLHQAIEAKKAEEREIINDLASNAGTMIVPVEANSIIPPDVDKDGVPDHEDNCPFHFNPDQANDDQHIPGAEADELGNHCDFDMDGDGIFNQQDEDRDGDGIPERQFPVLPDDANFLERGRILDLFQQPCVGNSNSYDPDEHIYCFDNAPWHYNPDQNDRDFDGVGDQEDGCYDTIWPDRWGEEEWGLYELATDRDRDGLSNPNPDVHMCDICDLVFDPNQEDENGDGIGDACQIRWEKVTHNMKGSATVEVIWLDDWDGDRVPNRTRETRAFLSDLGMEKSCKEGEGMYGTGTFATCYDNCRMHNPRQIDTDLDGVGDTCDDCDFNPNYQYLFQTPGDSCPAFIEYEEGVMDRLLGF